MAEPEGVAGLYVRGQRVHHGGDHAALAGFCGLYFVICFLGIGGWAVLGNAAVGLVRSERRMRWFNAAMGTLLVGVATYLLLSEVPPP